MFTLVEDGDTLTGVVNCDYPTKKGRKVITFDIEFVRPESDELTTLLSDARLADITKIGANVRKLVTSWTGFRDHAGNVIEFTEENLDQASRDSALAPAISNAMLTALSPGGARSKNSRARPAGTRS